MNKELHPRAEGLAQIEQVAGDANEQALLVHLGFAHGLQKFAQVGDFAVRSLRTPSFTNTRSRILRRWLSSHRISAFVKS
jgi:hypothetical protein